MEEKHKEEIAELLEQAKEIKEEFKLDSLDTALLILIQQDIDTIRFHNTD